MTRTLRSASSVVVEPATSSPKSRTCYDPSVTCRVAGSSSLKMEPMSEHSAWPCGTAGEWSVLTSHRRRSGQPGIMEHLQVVVGYDRVLTPAMSPIETSGNRARQLQRANWRACLPTASAILEDLSDPAFCMPDRKSMKPLKKSTVRVVAGLMTIPQVCLRRQGDALDRIYGRARAGGRTGRRARISETGKGLISVSRYKLNTASD